MEMGLGTGCPYEELGAMFFYFVRNAVRGEVAFAVWEISDKPSSKAVRPASTACLKAMAIFSGLEAMAMAVFTRTASAPSSIASAA